MRIAVLMSSYCGENYIREQIDSILAQNGNFDLDLWVRDDGSSDGTQQILQEYADQSKLRWYTGDNLKPACSFLNLIQQCSGYDYYAFADQDDYWMPDKLNTGVQALVSETGPALYCANAELVDGDLQSMGRNVYQSNPKTDFETLVCAGGILGCTMIFNRALRDIVCEGGMPKEIVLHDFYLAVVCAAVGGKLVFDPKVHMKYRQHENNVVGVPNGKLGTLVSRLNDIRYKEPVGIAKQAQTVMECFSNRMDATKLSWISVVADYKKTLVTRMKLAFSRKTKYINRNMGLKLRLSILFGNR